MGFTYHTILYVTRAAPEDMQWLTPEDGKRVGIEFVSTDTPASDVPDAEPVTISFADWREAMLMETMFRLYDRDFPKEAEEFFMQSYDIYLRTGSVLETVEEYKKHFLRWIFTVMKYTDDGILVEVAILHKKVIVYALKSDLSICGKLSSTNLWSSMVARRFFLEGYLFWLATDQKLSLKRSGGIVRDLERAAKRTLKQIPS